MTNFDDKTGIHYGAISYHSVMPEALDDVFNQGENQGEDEVYLYEQYGYKISNSPSLVCLFVEKSPWYTFARPCSPCAPNAGDLDNPEGLLKTYCLGPEWFEGEKSPYLVYSVADNTLVSRAASDTEG
jgi:hypothetical protein